MLDIIGITYFTLSTLSLLGIFPLKIFEFFDLQQGFTISDYGILFQTSTYFGVSAILTGLLCGIDSITNPIYKDKRVSKTLYNYHMFSSFALLGIVLFPLPGSLELNLSRILHWICALTFLIVYPITRLLIVREFNKKSFRVLSLLLAPLLLTALLLSILTKFTYFTYIEYILWMGVLVSIVVGKILLMRDCKDNNDISHTFL